MDALEQNPLDHSLRLSVGKTIEQFPRKLGENRMDILMETGTGKTYVYINTIFEIYKKFHKTKFVIIVPRMSIRHGVMQSIRQMGHHFFSRYGMRLRCVNYPDDGLRSVIHHFINTNDLAVLLITNSAFNSRVNRINRYDETLYGATTTWKRIIGLLPVVVMDEPHLLAGRRTAKYLKELRSKSLVIRFGATYPENEEDGISNVVYALDSISAFRKKLVKRISVSVVSSHAEESDVHVTGTRGRKKFSIQYTINGQSHNADVCLGDDLGAVTGLDLYSGRSATNIKRGEVVLNDGRRLPVGAYDLTDHEIQQMVQHTIRLHFKREREMFPMGIKTLSLFFIPGINDFRGDGRIKKIFENEYAKARRDVLQDDVSIQYRKYLERDYEDDKLRVHEGYFSGDKERPNEKEEANAVDIILKDKERLLSLNEPLRFIFSVWALREGWDNPNVFNICKLSHSAKDNSRRQQVGRGLRIAVDRRGIRMTQDRLAERKAEFHTINELNMVVPVYESAFIWDIQREIRNASPSIAVPKLTLDCLRDAGLNEVECSTIFVKLLQHGIIDENGNRLLPVQEFLESNLDCFSPIGAERLMEIANILQGLGGAVIDPRKIKTVRVKPERWQEFKSLWEQINRGVHVVYRNIDETDIIQKVCELFEKESISVARTRVTKWVYDSDSDTISAVESVTSGGSGYFQKSKFNESVVRIAQNHKWPIGFLLKILNQIDLVKFRSNPEAAERLLTAMIQDTIHRTILEKVEYEFAEATVYGNGLQHEDGSPIRAMSSTKLGKAYADEAPPKTFLYDTIPYDSHIELQSIREGDMEWMAGRSRSITVFAKLPRINIPTPYKTYNPDFAYVINNGGDKTLFLVVETKGYDSNVAIPEAEQKKIEYGRKFFESLQRTLPYGTEVCFQRRLNAEDMSEILRRCYSK